MGRRCSARGGRRRYRDKVASPPPPTTPLSHRAVRRPTHRLSAPGAVHSHIVTTREGRVGSCCRSSYRSCRSAGAWFVRARRTPMCCSRARAQPRVATIWLERARGSAATLRAPPRCARRVFGLKHRRPLRLDLAEFAGAGSTGRCSDGLVDGRGRRDRRRHRPPDKGLGQCAPSRIHTRAGELLPTCLRLRAARSCAIRSPRALPAADCRRQN